MHHTILYISLPSPHDKGVKIPNFTFYGGHKQATTNFSFSFKTWMWYPRNQLQGNSPTLDFFRELEWACFSRAQNPLLFPLERLARRLDYLSNRGKNGMFAFVTLTFLSDLSITLIAPLLFLSCQCCPLQCVIVVSINDNILLNSMYKSCSLLVITTKIELSMPVQ